MCTYSTCSHTYTYTNQQKCRYKNKYKHLPLFSLDGTVYILADPLFCSDLPENVTSIQFVLYSVCVCVCVGGREGSIGASSALAYSQVYSSRLPLTLSTLLISFSHSMPWSLFFYFLSHQFFSHIHRVTNLSSAFLLQLFICNFVLIYLNSHTVY